MVIETTDANSLLVVVIFWVGDMSVPESIICYDKTTAFKCGNSHFVSFNIGSLVAIDEYQIKIDTEFWSFSNSIANTKINEFGNGRVFYPWSREILLFIVYFEGDYFGFLRSLAPPFLAPSFSFNPSAMQIAE